MKIGNLVYYIDYKKIFDYCKDCNGIGYHYAEDDFGGYAPRRCKACNGIGSWLVENEKWRVYGPRQLYKQLENKKWCFSNFYPSFYSYKEDDIFKSKEAAQKECDRRNKIITNAKKYMYGS